MKEKKQTITTTKKFADSKTTPKNKPSYREREEKDQT